MSTDKTAMEFHDAKSSLHSALDKFVTAAELDDRDLKEELLDVIHDECGKEFVEELQS